MKTIAALGMTMMLLSFTKEPESETIYYISLNKAIHAGQFDGIARVADLNRYGDFGLGSEAQLNTELVMIDGVCYGIPADGRAIKLKSSDSLAFAAVKRFRSDTSFVLKNVATLKELETALTSAIHTNQFGAIKITGTFEAIQLRSFQKQRKPYKPVDEVPEVKFTKQHLQGTMVGFYTPKSALVLNSPSLHFHFIDDKRSTGGHLLDCKLVLGEVAVDYAYELHVILPREDDLRGIDLN